MGIFGAPEHTIGHHPAISEIDVLLKLYGEHLGIDLDDCANQPIPYSIPTLIVVAVDLNLIPHLKAFFSIRSGCKVKLSQFPPPGLVYKLK